jgi:hypothetical protein
LSVRFAHKYCRFSGGSSTIEAVFPTIFITVPGAWKLFGFHRKWEFTPNPKSRDMPGRLGGRNYRDPPSGSAFCLARHAPILRHVPIRQDDTRAREEASSL